MAHHVNKLAVDSMPREAAVGTLADETDVDAVVQSLTEAGIAADRLYFMQGEEGAGLIETSGNFISRLFESEVRARPVAALREGKTLLAVFGTEADDADTVRSALATAHVINIHYFGKWTYS